MKVFGFVISLALLLPVCLPTECVLSARLASPVEEQAVIVTIRLQSGEMGTSEERKRIFSLEDELSAAIEKAGAGEYDGNEFGEGTCTLYMYGPSAERLFAVVHPVLKKFNPPAGSYLIKRYGKPGAKEEKVPLAAEVARKPR